MANLPDLDTPNMGLTAFWNVNATVTQADLNNIIANLFSHTLYDNGVDGTVRVSTMGAIDNLAGRFLFRVRVRTDGLIVVWQLRSYDPDLLGPATATLRQAAGVGYGATRGVLLPYSQTGTRGGSVTLWALLCDALENLMTTTPFKTVVNTATVGHYDFQFPTMNKIYILGEDAFSSLTFTQPSSGNAVLFAALSASHWLDTSSIGGGYSFSHSTTVNALTINSNSGAHGVDYDRPALYYTLYPGHTNWPLSPVATVNNFDESGGQGGSGSQTNRHFGYITLYCLET